MFVVTGGGSGIGKALAHALATRHQSVFVVGRHESRLAETAAFSPKIEYCCADVSSTEGRHHLKTMLHDKVIQGLVHNAGVIDPISPINKIDALSWQRCMATNVDAPLFLTQLLLDKLDHARVLNISSGAAYFPVVGWAAYCVSKSALSMLTQCWQLESPSIAFASVMPGITDTNMQGLIREAEFMDPEKRDFFKRLKHDDRLISPETVAAFLCWLLLDVKRQDYVSREWDIYETSHHQAWLFPPNRVPALE